MRVLPSLSLARIVYACYADYERGFHFCYLNTTLTILKIPFCPKRFSHCLLHNRPLCRHATLPLTRALRDDIKNGCVTELSLSYDSVMNQLCSSLWTSRLWFSLTVGALTFSNVVGKKRKQKGFPRNWTLFNHTGVQLS